MSDIPVFIAADGLSGSERRISLSWSISQLRHKLEQFTGIPPSQQTLQLYSTAATTTPFMTISAGVLDDDTSPLAKLPNLVSYSRIVVVDVRPPGARENYTDVSQVEKFVMSEGDYEKRSDTVLAWKKQNRLGRFAETSDNNNNNQEGSPALSKQEEVELAEIADRKIKVGARCQLAEGSRRGTVRYVGKIPEIPVSATQPQLHWVGIELDEPLGKNDGSIKGVRYFQAAPNHGSFVKPGLVVIGDFPSELDDLFDDDDEEL
ncbi:hypothetical protein D0Z03_002968 [Geotrichum reessii]|nr:hypothetical protein D0Z03_002968 [Galactomyces reessii]